MTKKEYMKPELQVIRIQHKCQLLAYSVQTTGFGENDELTQDETPGDAWNDAMSRRRRLRNQNVWDDEEVLEEEMEDW